jgi:hypothetical protein
LDWDSLDRLHEKGYIGSPKSKAKSVTLRELATYCFHRSSCFGNLLFKSQRLRSPRLFHP